MLKRLNEEIKRRTHVVRIFPNGESYLRLVRARSVETHENWPFRERDRRFKSLFFPATLPPPTSACR